jgi:large subunit ribosomal protein L19
MNEISKFNQQQVERINAIRGFNVPNINVGDTVAVKYSISEGSTSRIQTFQGIVIAKTKALSNYCATFTVRKISSGVGIERKFPVYLPSITGIDILRSGSVRRAKLYYLRNLTGKSSKIKEKSEKPAA